MSSMRALAVAALAAGLLMSAGSVSAADGPKLSNKWRIECSEGANNDGTIRFRVTPKDGEAVEVAVNVAKGRGENGVAKDIRDSLRAGLDAETYHVETDDGEDVLVKKRKGPDFALELVESNVKGTRINIEKE